MTWKYYYYSNTVAVNHFPFNDVVVKPYLCENIVVNASVGNDTDFGIVPPIGGQFVFVCWQQ